MSVIEKVLLRKDMAAVAVAIVVGFVTLQFISSITSPIISSILDTFPETGSSFKDTYLLPTLLFGLQILALEGLLRIVIAARAYSATRIK